MTQIKIISESNMAALEEGVNKFLHDQREFIHSVIDIKFEMKERSGPGHGIPGSTIIFAFVIYSTK